MSGLSYCSNNKWRQHDHKCVDQEREREREREGEIEREGGGRVKGREEEREREGCYFVRCCTVFSDSLENKFGF